MNRMLVRFALVFAGIMSLGIMAPATQAGPVVRFNLAYSASDSSGPIDYFDVELFDTTAPVTVANFLRYVNYHNYDNTIIHRDVQDFIMQGGGFKPQVEGEFVTALNPITSYGAIPNEFSPARSNVSGTIAMAKVGGDPNSATNQWFVNVGNNSADLDSQNGGFTVFGKVLGAGMTLVNAVNSLPTYDLSTSFGGAFTEVPLFNHGTNFVTVTSAAVLPSPSTSLAGFVYVDTNHNGVMDGVDYAIGDAKVSLVQVGSNTPLATVSSGNDGSYRFNNLGPGMYSVKMETPCNPPGQDSGNGQMVLDKDGKTIISVGTAGTPQQNAYGDIWLGDGQKGVNFNFAESVYPVALMSARMLLNSRAGVPQTNAVAIPGTNAGSGSVLGFGNVLVGTPGNTTLTVTNLGGQGSVLSGTLSGASGECGPAGGSAFGPLDSGQGASQEYTYTPYFRGSNTQYITITSNVGNVKVTLSGMGVAPVSSLTESNPAYVLVGSTTTGAASITIKNEGDGNLSGAGESSNLKGSVAAGSGAFSGAGGGVSLADGASQTFSYTYAPTVRGETLSAIISTTFTNGNPDGTNSPHTQDTTLSGTGVAPVSSLTQNNPDYVLVGSTTTGAASITIKNEGDGNLSGAGESSNLKGSLSAGSGNFSLAGDGSVSLADSVSKTYTYVCTQRGTNSAAISIDFTNGNPDGTNSAHTRNITFSGTGVAPIQAVDTSAANAGLVRIGTTGTASVTINNLGNGNLSGVGAASNLNGTVASGSGKFSGSGDSISLADGATRTFGFTYTPTAHTADSTTIATQFSNGSADGKNLAENVDATLNGQGVGPVFSSDLAPSSTLDFGTIPHADTASLFLNVSNASTDDNAGNTALTDLTLLSAEITGTDGGLFSIAGFTAGTVLHKGDPLSLEIAYNGTGSHGAELSALLTIVTDEGVALGASGNAFTYQISAILAPEPGSLVLLAVAGLFLGGMAWWRRGG